MNEHSRLPLTNNPPSPIEWARETIDALGKWMADHPTVQTEADAREAKVFADRTDAALEAVEAERDGKVRPLNTQVATINAEYKALHNPDGKKSGKWGLFDKVFNELKARLARYLQAEEDRRLAALREAERIAQAALDAAREAEAKEIDAIESAAVGEIGVDITQVTKDANAAFKTFEHAQKAAEVAQIDTRVKIGGGFSKAIGLRTAKVLTLVDVAAAIAEIGPTEKITEAVLSSARDYRKLRGRLPKGVVENEERVL